MLCAKKENILLTKGNFTYKYSLCLSLNTLYAKVLAWSLSQRSTEDRWLILILKLLLLNMYISQYANLPKIL